MSSSHKMSLVKGKFSLGSWYPYFYMPPKSPDMSTYYGEVELQLSRVYSFLEKEQVRGKILDFLGVPNTGGKIYKAKLHKIFLLETSAKGRKKKKPINHEKEVKLDPPKSTRPYEGPFKFFKSKNLRKSSQGLEVSDVGLYGTSGFKSKKTSLEDECAVLPSHDETSFDEESSVCSTVKMRGFSPKSGRKTPRMNTENEVQTKVLRNRPRATSPLWFETILSPESSRSYSVESSDDSEFIGNSKLKNTNSHHRSKVAEPAEISGLISRPPSRREDDASNKTMEPNNFNILSSMDSVNDEIFTKPVKQSSVGVEMLPTVHHSNENPSQISKTLVPEESVSDRDKCDGASELHPPTGDCMSQLAASTMPFHDSSKHAISSDKVNMARKSVDFKNVEYYYYDKPDSSGSWTQRTGSNAWSEENKDDDCQNDSSEDNEFDTGFVSPMVMSQESQLMSQETLNMNSWLNSRPIHAAPRVCVKEQPLFPEVIVDERSRSQVLLKNTNFVEESTEPSKQLAQPEMERLLFSQVSSQEVSSPSQIGIYNPDLELVKRFGSMKPSDDERLSQISAATEVFGANVLVDLRNPEAIAAIEQHCKSILAAVKSHNVPPKIPRPSGSTESGQTFSLFKQHVVDCSQQILPIEYISAPTSDEQPIDAQEDSFKRELHQVGSRDIESGSQSFSLRTNQDSLRNEDFQKPTPVAKESDVIDPRSEISQASNAWSLTSLGQKGRLPFKKQLPVLSAPRIPTSAAFTKVPEFALIHSGPKKSYSHSEESSSASRATRWTNVPTDPLTSAGVTSLEGSAMGVTSSSGCIAKSAIRDKSVEAVTLSRSLAGEVPFASVNSVSITKTDPSSVASVKTTSLIDSVAATVKSSSLASMKIDSESSLAAEKHMSSSTLISGRDKMGQVVSDGGNNKCGSNSSKGSLKQWQRQANLAWKMSLPHISQQFFYVPGMGDASSIIDDVASRSGVTLSEPSSRVKVQNNEEPRGKLRNDSEAREIRDISTDDARLNIDETSEGNTLEMSVSPSTKSELGETTPFLRDVLFNDNLFEPLSVDPDADTQLKLQNESIDARPLKRDYSRELGSFLDLSIASRSTTEKALEDSYRDPILADPPRPPFPIWWRRDYSTPKQSLKEEATVSDDSIQVILPISQLQRDQALAAFAPAPSVDEQLNYDPLEAAPCPHRPGVSEDSRANLRRSPEVLHSVNRTSSVQTHVLTKPPCTNNQRTEHDFFIDMAHKLRPRQENSSINQ